MNSLLPGLRPSPAHPMILSNGNGKHGYGRAPRGAGVGGVRGVLRLRGPDFQMDNRRSAAAQDPAAAACWFGWDTVVTVTRPTMVGGARPVPVRRALFLP